jgi:hypothetical protein
MYCTVYKHNGRTDLVVIECSGAEQEYLDRHDGRLIALSGPTQRAADGAVCPECDEDVLETGYCMMGHWCGTPRPTGLIIDE